MAKDDKELSGLDKFKKDNENNNWKGQSGRKLGLNSNSLTGGNSGGEQNSISSQADDLTNKFKQKADQAANTAGKGIKKATKPLTDKAKGAAKNAAKKGAKETGKAAVKGGKAAAKAAAKAAKAAAKAAVEGAKVAGKAAASIAEFLFTTPPGWICLGVGLIIIVIMLIFNFGDSADKKENKYVEDSKGQLYRVEPDWQDRLELSYYATFSDRAYYYTIDDDDTLHQGGKIYETAADEGVIKDKYMRESSFVLSTGLIKYLDETLNDGKSFPEQFIKPVYNTCSTGENTTKGYCKTKELTETDEKKDNHGQLIVKSQGFIEHSGCTSLNNSGEKDSKTCGKYYTLDTNQSTYKDSQTIGVHSWGLAPILHYKKYEEKRWAQDLYVTNTTYFDVDDETYKTCKWTDCPDYVKEKITAQSDVEAVGEKDGKVTKGKINTKTISSDEKIDESSKNAYLIDSVASLAGTVSNDIEEVTEPSGEKFSSDVVVTEQLVKTTSDWDSELLLDEEYVKDTTITIDLSARKHVWDGDYDDFKSAAEEDSCDWYNVFCHVAKGAENLYHFVFGETSYEVTEDDLFVEGGWLYTDMHAKEERVRLSNCKTLKIEQKGKGKIGSKFSNSSDNEIKITCTSQDEDGEDIVFSTRDSKYNSVTLASGYKTSGKDKVAMEVNIEYDNGNGDYKKGVKCTKTYNTTYTIQGDYWTTEYKYKSSAPNTDGLDNGQYLRDYISNYQTYYANTDWDDVHSSKNFEEILNHYYGIAEGITGEVNEDNITYNSDYGKLVIQMYGDHIFKNQEAYLQSKLEQMESEETDTSGGYTGTLPIMEKSSSHNNCVISFKGYRPGGDRSKTNAWEMLKKYSEYYGVDPDLMIAMAIQEGGCKTDRWELSFEGTSGPAYGVFQMEKSVWVGKTITAFNYVANKEDVLTLDTPGYDTNIRFACMYMANLLKSYNGNLLMALQSYNYGGGGFKNWVIDRYAKATGVDSASVLNGDKYDLGWMAYRDNYPHGGDSTYIEHIVQYLNKPKIHIKLNNANEFDYDLYGTKNATDTVLTETDETALYIYWYKNKSIVYKNWSTFYPFKPKSALKINTKKGEFPNINTLVYNDDNFKASTSFFKIKDEKNLSDQAVSTALAKVLSAIDGTPVNDNMDLNDIGWKKKFTSLFSSLDADSLDMDIPDLVEYFGTYTSAPIPNIYVPARGYGYTVDKKTGKSTKNLDIKINAKLGTEVMAVAPGTVTSVSRSCVTIESKNESSKHWAAVEYCNITPKGLKRGDTIKTDQIIGTTRIDEEALDGITDYLSITLQLDGNYEDPTYILRTVELLTQYEYSVSNSMLKLAANEKTKAFTEYSKSHYSELEEWLNEDPVDFENINFIAESYAMNIYVTAGAWSYMGGSPHQGVDVASGGSYNCTTGKRFCNHIYTAGNGVILSVVDGIADNHGSNLTTNTGGNYSLVLYRGTNGNLYTIMYYHLTQNSPTEAFKNNDTSLLERGEWIGTLGHTGRSTGAHTHLHVINYGNMTVEQFFEHLGKYGIYAGINYQNAGTRCENTQKKPCWEKPQDFFNITVHTTVKPTNNCNKDIQSTLAWGTNKEIKLSDWDSCPAKSE